MSNQVAECAKCKRLYELGDDRRYPRHYRPLRQEEKRRAGQMSKRCEGSGAWCEAAKWWEEAQRS